MSKKILLVFGTRPEAIKMAPLVLELQRRSDQFKVVVCVTAQHRHMLDQVLTLFNIVPEFDLNIMKDGQDLYDITSRVLLGMRNILNEEKPDIVLVHGDTSTSTATSLAAFYQQIPVGHIEAGLRTNNIYSPWPEEINRQITGRIALFHFCPTALSQQNLKGESVQDNIHITGNTVIDALYWVLERIQNDKSLARKVTENLINAGLPLTRLLVWEERKSLAKVDRNLVLITGHRRENFGEGFLNICEAIRDLAQKFPSVDFVYPMHLNPNVRNAIKDVFGDIENRKSALFENIYFIEPLDYLPFVSLMSSSYIILTDSGGVQEEAPSLGKPVLVMRDTTERPEALIAGTVKLVGTNKGAIIEEISRLLTDKDYYQVMSKANNPYGDGKASQRIADVLNGFLNS